MQCRCIDHHIQLLLYANIAAVGNQKLLAQVQASWNKGDFDAVASLTQSITNADTKIFKETVSGSDGSYQVLLLPIGMYQVSAEAQGFRKLVAQPQKLEINQSLRIDLKLEVGAATETVEVNADASGVETVEAMLGTAVTANQILSAPLNGRNVMDLATLLPGVIPSSSSGQVPGPMNFSIAGARNDSVTYLLDGGVNSDLLSNGLVLNPNPDAIEEFRILTSNNNAEFGRSAGGVVNVVTRSGTNDLHGAFYDYVRNNFFNANSFFNNQQGLPRSNLKRNQFGATMSGPVVLPKVLNGRNKLFFMTSYQGQRLDQMLTANKVAVMTPAELTGDFSHATSSGGPDPNVMKWLIANPKYQPNPTLASQAIIASSGISPAAQNMIKAGLIPSSPSGYLFPTGASTNNADELTGKVDYNATQTDHLTLTLGASRNPALNPFANGAFVGANVPGYPDTMKLNHYAGTIDYTKTITTSMVNDFRFTAQRNRAINYVPAANLPAGPQLGIGIIPDDPTGPPILSVTGGMYTGFAYRGPTAEIDNTYIWADTFSWTRGRHNFKAGFNYTPFQDNTLYDYEANGQFNFYGSPSGSFSQNGLADFMMGLPDEYTQSPQAPTTIRTYNLGTYFQDDWKVTRNVTLNLGLRYEYSSPKYDKAGRTFSLDYGAQSTVFPNAPEGLLFPGDAQAPRGSNFADKNDFAPRFGFAWAPGGDSKTSIRGGAGVFYDILKGEDSLQFNGQAPFFGYTDMIYTPQLLAANGVSDALANPFGAGGQPNPFPSKAPASTINFKTAGYIPFAGSSVYAVDRNLRTPYVYQYNLSVQREIMRDTTLDISYIGSDSHKLTGTVDANPYVPGLATPTRLFNNQPGDNGAYLFSYFSEFANVGSAHYNSMALGLRKRFSDTKLGSFSYQFSYTLGKSIDNESGFRSSNGSVPAYDWGRFFGPSDFDLKDYVAFSGSWQLPFDRMWSHGPSRLTKGWTLYPLITWRSGLPLNVKAGVSRSGTKPGPSGYGDANLVQALLVSPIAYDNPNQTVVASNGKAGNFWFDPAAFSNAGLSSINGALTPSLATYGTLGRNAFRGPGVGNVNFTLGKTVDLYKERAKMEIRADFFNILNHPEWQNPSTTITSPTFGQISGTGTSTDPAARVIQLAARLTF